MSCNEELIKFLHFWIRLQNFLVYPDQGYQASCISLWAPFEMLRQGLNSQIHWKKRRKNNVTDGSKCYNLLTYAISFHMADLVVETTGKDNDISEKQCQTTMQNILYTATVIEPGDHLVQYMQKKNPGGRHL